MQVVDICQVLYAHDRLGAKCPARGLAELPALCSKSPHRHFPNCGYCASRVGNMPRAVMHAAAGTGRSRLPVGRTFPLRLRSPAGQVGILVQLVIDFSGGAGQAG